ncbi:MAG: hypothetical protein Q4B63_06325 [Clostridium perfringens]|nr:hypothetical protein [Clostridium perfringens]
MLYTLSISKEKIRNFLYDNKSLLTSGVFHIDFIPNKKLVNASKIYNVSVNSILALYDTTFLKSGKDGLLFSNNFIGVKHTFCSADKISYENLLTGGIDKIRKSIIINNTYVHLSKDEFVDFFMKLKIFLVVEDSASKIIYENYVKDRLDNIKLKIENNLYTNLDEEFLLLSKVIIEKYDIKTDAMLYYLGCLVFLEMFNFKEVNRYYLKVQELNQFSEDTINKLKEDIEKRKVQYEFNLLESEKNRFIEIHKYNDAINIVNKQKLLNIKPIEELDREIQKIAKLRENYIKSLEEKIVKNLLNNEYTEIFNTLDLLKEINPNEAYSEYYITAQIGTFDFANAMVNIQSLSETDEVLAKELENKLQIEKEKASQTIRIAVENKNYNFFKENEKLKSFKDKWGMTPLMYFIVKEDLDGIKLLKNEFNKDDTNLIGHTALNLIVLCNSYKFRSEVFRILDENLDKMIKKHKTKNTMGKFKKLALNGGELLNNNAIIRYDITEATASYENSINKSIESIEHEIHSYLDNLISKNEREFKALTINPKNFQEELNKLNELKSSAITYLEAIKQDKNTVESSFGDRLNESINKNLEGYIIEAAIIEVGAKDEFETTLEYEERKKAKIENIRANSLHNNYVKEKIEGLKIQVKLEIEYKVKELEDILKAKNEEILSLENKIKECSYLIHSKSIVDISEIFNYYYEEYKNNIDIGTYNADIEAFTSKISDKEIEVKVPRIIAREFKAEFKNLIPKYEKIVLKEDDKDIIENIFCYEFNGEKIKIPFMKW